MHSLIAPAINLGILLVVLFVYLKTPIQQFVSNRAVTVGQELKKVREMLRDAQEKHDEFSAKLKSIEIEVSALREQAKQDAQAAKLRILSEAQRACSTIVSDARSTSEGMYADLKTRLFSEIGQQILARTEVILRDRLTGDDRARIHSEFSTQVEAMK